MRYLEDRKCEEFLQHFIIKYRTRQTPLNFVIFQIDKYRAGCTEFLLCFPSVNIIASDMQCGMRKNGEKGKGNNFKLVGETIHRKLILTVLAYLHLRPDFKSYIYLIEKNTM